MKKIFNWLFKGRLKPVVIDADKLSEKAQEFAMKGALSVVEEYYTGYHSPFKKALTAQLEEHKVAWRMELPDIMALINDSLSAEITQVANTVVAKSFVPLMNRMLSRADKEMLFSDLLKGFIKDNDAEYDDCRINIEEPTGDIYLHMTVKLSCKEETWELRFMSDYKDHLKLPKDRRYNLSSLPSRQSTARTYEAPKMKLSIDGATLEMPFTRDVLSDSFTASCASYMIANTKFQMDCDDFDEDMFENDRCTC